jgi:hypothetical protein
VPESPSLEFRSPPRPLREDGTPRRVGVEIEVELDPQVAERRALEPEGMRVLLGEAPAEAGGERPVRAAGRSLAALLGPVVPRELITGPLAFDRLPEVDRLAALL